MQDVASEDIAYQDIAGVPIDTLFQARYFTKEAETKIKEAGGVLARQPEQHSNITPTSGY